MKYNAKAIRTFIGSKDYNQSRKFYCDLGFCEVIIDSDMSLFKVNDTLAFYLQDYYVKKWVDNSMIFIEVDDVEKCWRDLNERGLQHKYKNVRLTTIKHYDWGSECLMHDPSGILWHFGQFKK